jgi:hypothetical protein
MLVKKYFTIILISPCLPEFPPASKRIEMHPDTPEQQLTTSGSVFTTRLSLTPNGHFCLASQHSTLHPQNTPQTLPDKNFPQPP